MTEMLEHNTDTEQAVRDAFARMVKYQEGQDFKRILKAGWLESPVGVMFAIGDDEHLYMLSYINQSSLERKAALVQRKLQANLEMGSCAAITSITGEMKEYFKGEREYFETPVGLLGTSFQVRVWEELRKIPYASTISYTELAHRIEKPAAFRAVAQANAQNPLSIVVPCHRIINTDGAIGGYNAGIERKRWLLDFEQSVLAREDE